MLHDKDAPLASLLFQSIERSKVPFTSFAVVVPPESEYVTSSVVPKFAKVFVVPEKIPESGYLSQQLVKLYSDLYLDEEYILHVESDSIFTQWKHDCFFDEIGRIRMFCKPFSAGAEDVWKKGTEYLLHRAVKEDCLQSTPFLYRRHVFADLRADIYARHGMNIDNLVKEKYLQSHLIGWKAENLLFSEFNTLNHFWRGAFPNELKVHKNTEKATCSIHLGHEIDRNYDLVNPKLVFAYFQLAYLSFANMTQD